jgi:UDP-N-acetylglucosamine:LPS N-acetylglucosamine transferase
MSNTDASQEEPNNSDKSAVISTDKQDTNNDEVTSTTIPEIVAPTDAPNIGSDGKHTKAIKVLFLSSDTGGGHRASAQSLAGQFELLFPGSTYDLVDLATEAYLPPYNSIVSYYKHLSAHPSQWKLLYGVTNSRFMERAVDTNIKVMTVMCERGIRKKIMAIEPDVVVSVHPLQTSVPILSCAKISHETGKHLPMFTVVTDLGSAHSTWFANGVEKMFVGSNQIYDLAKERGKVPDDKLVQLGLPIRHDFAVEAERMGDRMSPEGKNYQRAVRAKLELPGTDRKTLLVMGGGEGVGSLANIVDALYSELVKQGINAVICVVCGRNETLKTSLEERDWDKVFQKSNDKPTKSSASRRKFFPTMPSMFSDLSGCGNDDLASVGCIETGGFKSLRKILSSGTLMNSDSNPVFIPSPTKAIEDEKKEDKSSSIPASATDEAETENHPTSRKLHYNRAASIGPIQQHEENLKGTGTEATIPPVTPENEVVPSSSMTRAPGKVEVVGLGFITNMAEYMVAADILVSKAGPGTISEAAALSLPVMLTSYLPGQEEGNVDYVIDGGFGAFCQDTDPQAVGEEVAQWLNDDGKMKAMSIAAKAKGAPHAARDIVQMIGDSTLKWREHNQQVVHAQEFVKTHTSPAVSPQNGDTSAAPSLAEESTVSTVSITPDPVSV